MRNTRIQSRKTVGKTRNTGPTIPQTKRGLCRYHKIIETATLLFLEKGYENTSLNEIIQVSGGSLTTAYRCFENKEGLFLAVIESRVQEIKQRFTLYSIYGNDYRKDLHEFVVFLYNNMCDPRIFRLMLMGMPMEIFRKKLLTLLYQVIFDPFKNLLQQLETNYNLRFIPGLDETSLIIQRHARGTVLEILFDKSNFEQKKQNGIEQTTRILLALTDVSQIKTEKSVPVKKQTIGKDRC